MKQGKEEKCILLIVMAVASFAILTFFTLWITTAQSEESLTGAVVKGQITTLCKDSDGTNGERKGIVTVFYGSLFPDQCYDDKAASEDPVNNGRYLRETICKNNEPSYKIYDCGKNKCQYGACVSIGYFLVK